MVTNQRRASIITWTLRLLGAAICLFGVPMAIGGVMLAGVGGSWYFLLMGAVMTASGVLIARRRVAGAWLYGAAFAATIVWALGDAGFAFWPLVSRLVALAVLATAVAALYPLLAPRGRRVAWGGAAVLVAALVATGIYAFMPVPIVAAQGPAPRLAVTQKGPQENWTAWANDDRGTRFARLTQITKDNVSRLTPAWTAHTGDVAVSDGFGAEDQNTPLQVGDTLYVCTPFNRVIALDVDSGRRKWRFDPNSTVPGWQRCRSLGYHQAAAAPSGEVCRQRLFVTTGDARLIAIDAADGRPCPGFGNNGQVDLKVDMGLIEPGYYTQTAAPLVAGDLVIVGGRIADNVSTGLAGGVVRAYDVASGDLRWAWDPGNPAITRRPPPGQSYTRATPNVWAGMAYDATLGLVYLPTGNTTPDFFGATRTARDNMWNSSVVALDVATGRPRWRFQAVHRDLWDFDMPAQPLLYDIPDGRGGTLPALVQVTKQGQIFLLNRATGRPIAPVAERRVPRGLIPEEVYSPTQPFSSMPSIGTERLTEADMWGATPIDQMLCRIAFRRMRYDGAFTPPGVKRTLQFPGSLGGMNWGSVSIDMTTGYMLVNDMRIGLWNELVPRAKMPAGPASGTEMGVSTMTGTPYGSRRDRFVSVAGIPCQKPPYGTMTAIDLAARKVAWQVPLGTVRDTGPFGIKMHLPIPIGMPTLGGALTTESGLVFFAGTQDYYLRALDSATGRELWKGRLPVGSGGSPMTYRSPRTGKQYVVVTAGGARQSPDRGDYVIAYALP
ncbi:membrane-bound PQQ-dependent dehydrogenase, glucose/quinate/shikimate family [Sphingomonas corticis]|jgi:quinate dehydrogenase (quinone)|uniref:Membrane-bound PQQ-dependent dehydrogenase, glucose/quinate/shikimate family n=1 Tax=Sphingomonas corticis TaxID=2722791 RepID=A0ABX1CN65_9SPHN|nr:membrane-bound PQQ-dependent dehydrogenase, glucose/quinate/shikimate family [Sphingomonas corticis]NJR79393.1 membrane-bound PQQ-dependent dehydrogenase, glucose/quinate/shikimate family [Sphingomonas corticis]